MLGRMDEGTDGWMLCLLFDMRWDDEMCWSELLDVPCQYDGFPKRSYMMLFKHRSLDVVIKKWMTMEEHFFDVDAHLFSLNQDS